jgi:NAD(P)-dependent dehydrogenase (short-subunit alcohol dehydrogenase family)
MDLGLKGRKAIITGGSRGLGRAAAETLAAEGCDIAICSRGAEGVETAKKSLEAKGVKVFAQAVDVGDKDALEGFIAAAIADLGGLDILVSNPSGGNGVDESAWKANFEVDLMGAVRSVNASVAALSESDSGSVIFISSTAAVETFMGPTSYNAIKAGLITHANGLSQALAGKGIRVNTVSPGPIMVEGGSWDMIKTHNEAMYNATVAQIPAGRLGTDQEVADAIAFLASPRSGFTTGVNLVIDGGFTKRVNF